MVKRFLDAVRRNHALEHATITVMLSKQGPMRVVGRASADGFWVYGNVTTERLREFADEALQRLQAGESHLAVTPLCGTNIAVAGVLAGVGSYAAMAGRGRLGGLPGAIVASIAAIVAAQPLGRLVQKHYTTLAELGGLRIESVRPVGKMSRVHKVRTAQ